MKKIYFYIVKCMICLILFLILAIICKGNVEYKDYVYKSMYEDCFDFSGVRKFYNKYMGGVFPIESVKNTKVTSVFGDKLVYKKVSDYEDGAMLEVDYNYLVPAINSGIIVYIGEKSKYGNVVIVNGEDGEDIWYGNLCNVIGKLYDGVDKGSYIGEVCDNKMYMVVTKKNNFLDYRDYLD